MTFIIYLYYRIVSKSPIPEFNIGTTFLATIQTYDEKVFIYQVKKSKRGATVFKFSYRVNKQNGMVITDLQ